MNAQFLTNIEPITNPFNIDIKSLNKPFDPNSDPNVNPFGNFKPMSLINTLDYIKPISAINPFNNFKLIEELKSLSPIPYVNTMSKPQVLFPNSDDKSISETKPKRNVTKLNGKFKNIKFGNIKIKEFEGEINFDN